MRPGKLSESHLSEILAWLRALYSVETHSGFYNWAVSHCSSAVAHLPIEFHCIDCNSMPRNSVSSVALSTDKQPEIHSRGDYGPNYKGMVDLNRKALWGDLYRVLQNPRNREYSKV